MKPKSFIVGVLCGAALLCLIAAVEKRADGFYFIGGQPGEPKILSQQNGQGCPWLQFNTSTNTVFQIDSNGVISAGSFLNGFTTNLNVLCQGPLTNKLYFSGGVLTNVVQQ